MVSKEFLDEAISLCEDYHDTWNPLFIHKDLGDNKKLMIIMAVENRLDFIRQIHNWSLKRMNGG